MHIEEDAKKKIAKVEIPAIQVFSFVLLQRTHCWLLVAAVAERMISFFNLQQYFIRFFFCMLSIKARKR